ncbi:MAG: cytochrome P450 [Burkholderiaceae bacterium]
MSATSDETQTMPRSSELRVNLSDAAFIEDPYPVYARLRAEDPIHVIGDKVLISRYADYCAICTDKRMSNDRKEIWEKAVGKNVIYEHRTTTLNFRDPPDHTRLRRHISRFFVPPNVRSFEPFIQSTVDELLDAIEEKGGGDLVKDFAFPLPAMVIGELLGIPKEIRHNFYKWGEVSAATQEPHVRPQVITDGIATYDEMLAILGELAEQRLREPRGDLISAMVASVGLNDGMTMKEVLHNAAFMVNAGHETTMNTILNGLNALFRFPDQMSLLRGDPGLIETAVDEMLRYDSPVQMNRRMPKVDVEIGGKKIAAGSDMLMAIGSANRDEAQFPQADRFDVRRTPNRHVAFGTPNIHFCMGAPFARLEVQTAINALLKKFPRLAPASPPVRSKRLRFRGFEQMQVTA